ncbi:PRTRC system ThiF family protein [Flavobacterium supellecticarium]|uniref:PRTRC system ThiF family protein n=1 Tax=Flavobacterium supellecticarium TaxID=2565924 RepID=A0A4S4A520_9FLAO|nr:PRTRC system ThiF family protein [Flavobacterium supellecticarium]THF53035.1 PRTRC system ThiF family protein [Flavobacterium supellecticarium]
MKTQTAMHYVDNYLLNPMNPITVNLIGAGGSGNTMLTALARINHSLIALGHPGIQLNIFDDDTVTEANQGRQLFAESELGLYKSVVLINRINRFFGTDWKAITYRFEKGKLRSMPNHGRANLYISCVDSADARFVIADILKNLPSGRNQRDTPLYWMDLGNSLKTGQVILSTLGYIEQPKSKLYKPVSYLPMVTEEYAEILNSQDETDIPSCSIAEALEKQDLFINSTLVNMAGSLLWDMFRNGMTPYRGFFLNLASFRTEPIRVQ